jgi:hypothetical protein
LNGERKGTLQAEANPSRYGEEMRCKVKKMLVKKVFYSRPVRVSRCGGLQVGDGRHQIETDIKCT